MTQNEALKKFLGRFSLEEISPEEFITLSNSFKRETIKKKSMIFLNGELNTKHYFVEKGLLRLFVSDPSGREFNILFARENQIIGDLVTPEPTPYNLASIEDSIVHSITNADLANLQHKLPGGSAFSAEETIRRSYIFLQKRMVSILTKSAEENYIELQRTYPELLQRLPQYHIASYMGISAEFLSKVIAKSVRK